MWSAFHGMAELLRQAQSQLSVAKATTSSSSSSPPRSPPISAYLGSTTKNIRILLDDRSDWDVVGHEFGHAIADEPMSLDAGAGVALAMG